MSWILLMLTIQGGCQHAKADLSGFDPVGIPGLRWAT